MSSTPANKKNDGWPEILVLSAKHTAIGAYWILREIQHGIQYRLIPVHYFLIWMIPAFVLLLFRWDYALLSHTRFIRLYPFRPFLYWSYAFTLLYFPFIVWAGKRAGDFRRLLRTLTVTFQDAGLITPTGRMPRFISDKPMDDAVREMRVAMNGTPLSKFIEAKERLSEIFGHIEEFTSPGHGILAIQYSHVELPRNTDIFDVPLALPPDTFAIGHTRSGLLTTNLTAIPHFLIGGTTNTGKSTYVRQMISTLIIYNPTLQIQFIDLKEEMEAGPFRGVERVITHGSVPEAVRVLGEAEKKIKDRAHFFAENGYTAIEQFFNNPSRIKRWTQAVPDAKAIYREVILIDEAASLFLAGADATADQAKKAKRSAIAIAAKGRAVGVHLIVSTQRPDKTSVDMAIKTNLLGRLAFRTSDHPSSMVILDNTRAALLPEQPGRAIWKVGGQMKEIQTLNLSADAMKAALTRRGLLKTDDSGKRPTVKKESSPSAETATESQEEIR